MTATPIRQQGCFHNADAGALKEAFEIAVESLPADAAADAGKREELAAAILAQFRREGDVGEADASSLAESGLQRFLCESSPTEPVAAHASHGRRSRRFEEPVRTAAARRLAAR